VPLSKCCTLECEFFDAVDNLPVPSSDTCSNQRALRVPLRSRAYNQSPEAVAFYEFTRTMQSYKSIIAENTTLVLSTGSDLFKFLKGMSPDGDVIPASRPGGDR
jgi:hypothetical protein